MSPSSPAAPEASSGVPSSSKDQPTEASAQGDAASPQPESETERETGEVSDTDDSPEAGGKATTGTDGSAPPLPNEPLPDGPPLPKEPVPGSGPPLPNEPVPQPADDGWDCQWDQTTQAWFFYNRFTGKTQWDNPRVATDAAAPAAPAAPAAQSNGPAPPTTEKPAAGGYNPAIHGDYDPNAWYAQGNNEDDNGESSASAAASAQGDHYAATASFNRFTGQFQTGDMGPGRHTDEAKSRRQMNAFFDVDAAANSHDGRSLKAERSGKKPSKSELKAFKEKRRARKEEKRRAWLRD